MKINADEGMKVNMIIALNSQPIRLKNNLKNLQRYQRYSA